MMEFAKDLVSNVGCATSDFAKRVGGGTADAARWVGGNTADLAKRVGGGTADLAKRVGPKRGIIGLVVLGAAITGGIFLVRYLRERSEEAEEIAGAPMSRKMARKAKRAEHRAQMAH